MGRDYRQIEWDAEVVEDCRELIRLAVREDLDRVYDWTTVALVDASAEARAIVRARRGGVIAGLPALALVAEQYDPRIVVTTQVVDGARVEPGQSLATLVGPARSLLAAERPLLNLLGHVSGVATCTRRYVDAVAGTPAG